MTGNGAGAESRTTNNASFVPWLPSLMFKFVEYRKGTFAREMKDATLFEVKVSPGSPSTVALFVAYPGCVALKTRVTATELPGEISPKRQKISPLVTTQLPCDGVTESGVRFAGTESARRTFVAVFGPELRMVHKETKFCPQGVRPFGGCISMERSF